MKDSEKRTTTKLVRLNDKEMFYLQRLMTKYGFTTFAEVVRFLLKKELIDKKG